MNVGRIEGEVRRVGRKLRTRAIVWKLDRIAKKSFILDDIHYRRRITILEKYEVDKGRYGTGKAVTLRNIRLRAVER